MLDPGSSAVALPDHPPDALSRAPLGRLPLIAQTRITAAYEDIGRTVAIAQSVRALVRLLDPYLAQRRYPLARDIAALLKRLYRARRPLRDERLVLAEKLHVLGFPHCLRRITEWLD